MNKKLSIVSKRRLKPLSNVKVLKNKKIARKLYKAIGKCKSLKKVINSKYKLLVDSNKILNKKIKFYNLRNAIGKYQKYLSKRTVLKIRLAVLNGVGSLKDLEIENKRHTLKQFLVRKLNRIKVARERFKKAELYNRLKFTRKRFSMKRAFKPFTGKSKKLIPWAGKQSKQQQRPKIYKVEQFKQRFNSAKAK